jgi:hypothetical protein
MDTKAVTRVVFPLGSMSLGHQICASGFTAVAANLNALSTSEKRSSGEEEKSPSQ